MNSFEGDGRRNLRHSNIAIDRRPGTRPWPSISLCTARKYIADFERLGSYYSMRGGVLWAHELYCAERQIPYEVSGDNSQGWTIRRTDR